MLSFYESRGGIAIHIKLCAQGPANPRVQPVWFLAAAAVGLPAPPSNAFYWVLPFELVEPGALSCIPLPIWIIAGVVPSRRSTVGCMAHAVGVSATLLAAVRLASPCSERSVMLLPDKNRKSDTWLS